jgi:hypothetical protein
MWSVLLIALLVLLCIDWYQTEVIASKPDLFYETNVFLGKHPSRKEVTLYFLGVISGITALAIWLPHDWSLAGMTVGILVEGYYIWNNYTLGIR